MQEIRAHTQEIVLPVHHQGSTGIAAMAATSDFAVVFRLVDIQQDGQPVFAVLDPKTCRPDPVLTTDIQKVIGTSAMSLCRVSWLHLHHSEEPHITGTKRFYDWVLSQLPQRGVASAIVANQTQFDLKGLTKLEIAWMIIQKWPQHFDGSDLHLLEQMTKVVLLAIWEVGKDAKIAQEMAKQSRGRRRGVRSKRHDTTRFVMIFIT